MRQKEMIESLNGGTVRFGSELSSIHVKPRKNVERKPEARRLESLLLNLEMETFANAPFALPLTS